MDDVFDAAWRERFSGRHPAVESELATLIDVHGSSLLGQAEQLRLLLTQACPDAQRQVTVLLAAISAGVAMRLRGASDDADLPAVLQSCVGQLQRHGVDEVDWAWWAVRTWAHAFALPTGSGPRPSLPESAATRAPFAPWQAEPKTTAAPVGSPAMRARPAAPSPVAPIEAPAAMPAESPMAPRTVHPVEHPIEPVLPIAAAVSTPVPIEPVIAETISAPIPIAPAVVDPLPTPIPIEAAVAARREPVLGDTRSLGEPTFAATVAAPADDADGFAPTAFMPGRAWNDSDDRPRRTRRPALIAAAIVVPLAALLAWFAWSWNAAQVAAPPTPIAQTPATPPPEPAAPAPAIAANPATTPAAGPAETTMPAPASAVEAPKAEPVAPPTIPAPPPPAAEPKPLAATPAPTPAATVPAAPPPAAPTPAAPPPAAGLPLPPTPPAPQPAAPVAPPVAAKPVVPKADTPRVVEVVAACTPATCGTVEETSEVAGTTARYSLVVRTTDGGSLTFTAPYRLQAGTRVRVAGGRVVPIAAE